MTTGAFTLSPVISINGTEEHGISHNVNAITVDEHISGLYACEVELLNAGRTGFLYFDREKLDFGKEIEVTVGFGGSNERLFKGYITAMEASFLPGGGSRLTLLAEDRLQDMRMTRRTRTFEDMSDPDVIEAIAREYSLTPDLEGVSGATHRVVAQTNLSDLAFLRECARRLNAEIWIEDSTLHVAARTSRGQTRVQLSYGANLLGFQVRADLAHQCTEMVVNGWDPQAKEAISETADESTISSELNGGTSGGDVLRQAFGERKASLVHTVPLSTDEAKSVAEARYRERARCFVTGTGIADGDPEIRVGSILELSRLGALFDGDYYIVRVRHSLNFDSGFQTEFDVERASIP